MRIDATTIDDYFAKSGSFEPDLRALDTLIQQYAPDLSREFFTSPSMTGVGYGVLPYQSKSMKEPGRWPLLALAAQKHYIALYACAVLDDGQYIAESYGEKLGKANIGRSCIRFKQLTDLDHDILIQLLRDLNERYVASTGLF